MSESQEFCAPEPTSQHKWLAQLVGEWEYTGGEDHPVNGTESVRAFGDLWIMAEGQGAMPNGEPSGSCFTIGYDPEKGKFVSTWIGTMMCNLWICEGDLSENGKVLTLNSRGPSMSGDGSMANYRDMIEIVSPTKRLLRAEMQGEDGTWSEFMRTTYVRV